MVIVLLLLGLQSLCQTLVITPVLINGIALSTSDMASALVGALKVWVNLLVLQPAWALKAETIKAAARKNFMAFSSVCFWFFLAMFLWQSN